MIIIVKVVLVNEWLVIKKQGVRSTGKIDIA